MSDMRLSSIIKPKKSSSYLKELKLMAQIRTIFLSQDNYSIKDILKKDLEKYITGEDINSVFPITIDDFIPQFLENLMQVHKKPVLFKWQEEEEIEKPTDEDLSMFNQMISETGFHLKAQENDTKMRFHNTILVAVRYYSPLDKLYIDNSFNAGNTTIISYQGFETEPMIVYRDYSTSDVNKFIVWDRRYDFQYFTKEEPEFDKELDDIKNKKYIEEYDLDGKVTQRLLDENEIVRSYFPFVVFRYKDQGNGFWQNGMDSIVELVRMMNVLFTVMGEDSIRETLRILFLPFEILGRDGKPGELKTGLRNPIYKLKSGLEPPGEAQIISAPLYNNEIIQLIDKLAEMTGGLQNLNSPLKADVISNLSGVAIRLKNEPILNQWAKDINIVRDLDWLLIEKMIEVNNFHINTSERDTSIFKLIKSEIMNALILDYQEPQIAFYDNETYELERKKWKDGVSSPVEYVQRRNPEWDQEQCREYIDKNKNTYDEIFGFGGGKSIKKEEPQTLEELINA